MTNTNHPGLRRTQGQGPVGRIQMFHVFLLCSGFAALVNLGAGYLLYGQLGMDGTLSYPLSVALAFLSGMGVSFALNRRYTYPPSGRTKRSEMADFLAVSLVGLLLTTVLAFGLREAGAGLMDAVRPAAVLPETMAHIVAVGLTAIYSFLAHKFISFRHAGSDAPGAVGRMSTGQSRG